MHAICYCAACDTQHAAVRSDDACDLLQIAEVIAGLSAMLYMYDEHYATSAALIAADLRKLKAKIDVLMSPFKDCTIQVSDAMPQLSHAAPTSLGEQPFVCTCTYDHDSMPGLQFVKTIPSQAVNVVLDADTSFGYYSQYVHGAKYIGLHRDTCCCGGQPC